MRPTQRPIGYWLKHLHDLIEGQFDATLADQGLGRRGWQILNLLHDQPRSHAQIEQELAPFWHDPGPGLAASLDGPAGLIGRGWVRAGDDGRYRLTPAGQRAQALIAQRVDGTRTRLMRGLTPQQYADTVEILAVMASNMEHALAEHTPPAAAQPVRAG